MDVPAALNIPIGNSASPVADLATANSTRPNDKNFSEHFDRHVDRIKGEQREVASKPVEKAGNASVAKPAADDQGNIGDVSNTAETATSPRGKPVPEGDETLPLGLAVLSEDAQMLDQASGLTIAVDVISAKRGVGVDTDALSVSGNDLPTAADDGDTLADTDDLVANLGVTDKDIRFDPLSQAKESSAHIAALSAGPLPGEKVRFNGKSSVADFVNPSAVALSLDKGDHAKISELVLDQLGKASQDANLTAGLGKEAAMAKVATNAEGLPLNAAAILNSASQQTASTQAIVDKPSIPLDTPMSHPRWGQDFSQRVQWVVNQSMSGAQIRLNPHNMGPVEVRIQMQNDQATVSFTAQHGATREAIEAAMPRLREMFSEQNITMADVDISQHSFAEQREQYASSGEEGEQGNLADAEQNDDALLFEEDNQRQQYTGLFSDFA